MASSPERTTSAAFDRYIAESQSRSRSGSANSTSFIASSSLPPPPRSRPKRAGANVSSNVNSSASASTSSLTNVKTISHSNSSSNGSIIGTVGAGVIGSSSTSTNSSPLSLPGSSPPNKDTQIQAAVGMSGSNGAIRKGFNSSRPGFIGEPISTGVGSGPGSTTTANNNKDGNDARRPDPSTVYGLGPHYDRRSNSFSSNNSYSNLFYRQSSEYIHTGGLPNVPHDVNNRDSQALSFDETLSIEDYSDLLYPDLPLGVDSPRSQPPSLNEKRVHGPPTRKRIPSFVSEEPEGPESPVEFAGLPRFPSGPTGDTPKGTTTSSGQSKVDKLLGINSGMSKAQSDKHIADYARRDSFMDFDGPQGDASSSSHSGKTSMQDSSPISANFPMFAPRRVESIEATQPNKTLKEYRALVETVQKRGDSLDLSPRQEPNRQIFVDGSDKKAIPTRATPSPVAVMESIVNQSPNSTAPGSPSSTDRPPTSNLLDQKERADLVRKTRKIVQVLGPAVVPVVGSDSGNLRREALHRATRSDVLPLDDPKRGGKQAKRDTPSPDEPRSSWEPLNNRDTIYMSGSERRHSSPISGSFSEDTHKRLDSDNASLSSLGSIITPEKRAERDHERPRSGSPTSFIDLTDEEGVKTPKMRASSELKHSEGSSSETASSGGKDTRNIVAPIANTPAATSKHHAARVASLTSSLSFSLSDEDKDVWSGKDLSPQDESALERQRKREKLARIHRYLGSRVPPELVLGQGGSITPPPGPSPNDHQHKTTGPGSDGSVESVTEWKKRRRSLSAATYRTWETQTQPEVEMRSKDTLSSTDRVLHVRRAQKIEQILGEQAFYHLPRPATAPLQNPFQDDETLSQTPSQGRRLQKTDPDGSRQFKPRSAPAWKDGRPSTAGSSRPSTAQSRPSTAQSLSQSMMSHSTTKGSEGGKYGKFGPADAENSHEPQTVVVPAPTFPVGTASSSPWEDVSKYDVLDISPRSFYAQQHGPSKTPGEPSVRTSRQFLDYKNSLNTLNRILDNDDRHSLHELHTVLDEDEEEAERDERESQERRGPPTSNLDLPDRSIRPRASLLSLQSVATVSSYATLTPEPMGFQARRKRAAKLAHFFGASYRDLFGEVLDRIERGMLEEMSQGELSRDEMRQLMDQLNQLKSRQAQIS